MNDITCQELLDLRENYQFEVKSAQGCNGNREVPKDVWPSYSAMKKLGKETFFKFCNITLRMQPNVQPQALTVQVNCLKSYEG